ncbi:MAG: response regulator [Deltaproteobacteria bacterium]|nr:MAG: response regulator [Deltaproteobacteria bacterium]RLB79841.1 MAG: response regulator [Deltaproteobacteria bacterium]
MTHSPLQNKRLLAVDDEPDVLEVLSEQLEGIKGLLLDKATDYETGYHMLRSWSYDLVILDIMGVRGFDLLNAAVALGFPAVMLTAHMLSPSALRKSVEMGASAFIPKEYMTEMVPFLEDVLSLSSGAMWKRLFDRLGGFFSEKFGQDWMKDKKEFWEEVASGRYTPQPVILK